MRREGTNDERLDERLSSLQQAVDTWSSAPPRAWRSVRDALPEVNDTFFLEQWSNKQACVLSSSSVANTLRCRCSYVPSRYVAREKDAGPFEKATILTPMQRGVIAGFPRDFDWVLDESKLPHRRAASATAAPAPSCRCAARRLRSNFSILRRSSADMSSVMTLCFRFRFCLFLASVSFAFASFVQSCEILLSFCHLRACVSQNCGDSPYFTNVRWVMLEKYTIW